MTALTRSTVAAWAGNSTSHQVAPDVPTGMAQTFAAMTHLDEAVTGAGGIALRYGALYGPHEDTQTEAVRKRRYPVIGGGPGLPRRLPPLRAAYTSGLTQPAAHPPHLSGWWVAGP
jgi:hypothetical protein